MKGYMKIPKNNVKELQEKGYTDVVLPNGKIRTITTDDIVFNAKEIEQLSTRMKTGQLLNI